MSAQPPDNLQIPDLNPWKDDEDGKPSPPLVQHPMKTSDPVLTANVFSPDNNDPPHHPPSPKEVLREFDPLVSPEEQAAREAWQTSEGHPPPREETVPLSSRLPTSLSASPPSRSSSPFPSFASIAKTFSLPNLTRPKPPAINAAEPVSERAISDAAESSPPAGGSTDGSVGGVSPAPTSPDQQTDVQFDFQRFLDQMKTRSAEPVSKYLRSFLSHFTKRSVPVGDQVRVVSGFLDFIAGHMRNCEVWKNAEDAEFDNALEGMEKLVMNRLYDFTFTPQIVLTPHPRSYNPDDIERDRVLAQRISLFGWIEEKHLDVPIGEGSQGFLMFAQQELLKINHYKAPRDKLICILNCCKVIFGLVRHLKKEEGADSFVPILIFVVLKANPPHLMSNVEFINRFRNPAKLQGEAGYYLSSLTGAISFIETMDHTSLSNIMKEEFEGNVEAAIQALPGADPQSPIITRQEPSQYLSTLGKEAAPPPHAGDESAQPLALSTPTPSQSIGEDARRLLQKTGDTISKPLNAIGRIFSEALDGAENKFAYLPGPFAPFELGREQREAADGQPSQQLQQDPRTSPQRPSSAAPQIHTPYKPRVRRIPAPLSHPPSPRVSSYSFEDTPSRSPRGSPRMAQWQGQQGQVPMTHQPLALGPSQPYISPNSSNYPYIHSPTPHGPLPQGYPHGYPEQFSHQGQPPPPLPPRRQSLVRPSSVPPDGGGRSFASPAAVDASSAQGSNTSISPLSYVSRTPTPTLDLSNVQAEIDQAHANAAAAAKETLMQIFPGTENEVIDLVLEANGGDLGKSIEALLEMSSGQ